MKGKRRIFARCAAALCALWICAALLAPMTAQTTQDTQTEKSTKAKRHKKSTSTGSASRSAPVTNASPADIQAAKANGEVWVNTDSGIYHKGGKWYGATKNGKFMSEQDAIKSGYKLAKNEK
jgi:ABC-type phosphate transport system substrate-binding protein